MLGNPSKYILEVGWDNPVSGVRERWYLDSAETYNFCGRYINDSRNYGFTHNVRFGWNCSSTVHPHCGKFYTYVYATMDIPAGVELFVNYGEKYWEGCPFIPMSVVERLMPEIM